MSDEDIGDAKGFFGSIPEGFYDMIGRVAVGCAAIALYKWDDIPTLLHTTESATVLLFATLVFSWIIGLTLEVVGYSLYLLRSKWCKESGKDELNIEEQIPKNSLERNRRLKFMAEILFFRSMIVLSGLTLLVPPSVFRELAFEWHWTCPCLRPRIISIVSLATAACCWGFKRKDYHHHIAIFNKHPHS